MRLKTKKIIKIKTTYCIIMIKSRKITEEDLFGHQINNKPSKENTHSTTTLQKYKNQEFGAKKRIKP